MPPILRSVLLLHTLPDGSSHHDWLIEPAPAAPLLTFRLTTFFHPAQPDPIHFVAQPLSDHRAIYLDYEGPISNNRGTVRRLWTTCAKIIARTPTLLTLNLQTPQTHTRTLTGTLPTHPILWHFTDVHPTPTPPSHAPGSP